MSVASAPSSMSLRAPVPKLSSSAFRIYVGPAGEEKIYSLPRDLIAYYSTYFAACFKNNWKEAEEGILRLPDEKAEFFDVLVDYFRHGEAKYTPVGDNGSEFDWDRILQKCFSFIRFTDLYDVIGAADAVSERLSTIFAEHLRFDDCVLAVGLDEMQFCLERLQPHNKVLSVIANTCVRRLADIGPKSSQRWNEREDGRAEDTSVCNINELVRTNKNLAAAMWRQVQHSELEPKGWTKVSFQISDTPL